LSEPSDRLVNLFGALCLGVADKVRASALADIELGGETAAAVVVVGHTPGLSIGQLGKVLGLSHPGTVRLVDRLVGAGFVLRRTAARDQRAVTIHLTGAGETFRVDLLRRRAGVLAEVLRDLPAGEQVALEKTAETLLSRMPNDAVSALGVCRFCDNERCLECPMDSFGPVQVASA